MPQAFDIMKGYWQAWGNQPEFNYTLSAISLINKLIQETNKHKFLDWGGDGYSICNYSGFLISSETEI